MRIVIFEIPMIVAFYWNFPLPVHPIFLNTEVRKGKSRFSSTSPRKSFILQNLHSKNVGDQESPQNVFSVKKCGSYQLAWGFSRLER